MGSLVQASPSPSVVHVPARVSLGSELDDVAVNGILVSHREHGGGATLAPHEHGSAYLCVVLTGGYVQAAAREIECRRGSLVAHPEGHIHANRFGSATTRCVNLYFDEAWLVDTSLSALFADYRHRELDPRQELVARLERELATRDASSALAIASAALDLLGLIARSAMADMRPSWLRRVKDAIGGDLTRSQSLDELAALAGVHPAHLCRAFRDATGETLGGFSRRLRLEAADRLLCGTSSIAEIAAATGFYDQAHLARCFRRSFGASPSARRMQRTS